MRKTEKENILSEISEVKIKIWDNSIKSTPRQKPNLPEVTFVWEYDLFLLGGREISPAFLVVWTSGKILKIVHRDRRIYKKEAYSILAKTRDVLLKTLKEITFQERPPSRNEVTITDFWIRNVVGRK